MFAQSNQPQGNYGQPAQPLPSLAQVMSGGVPSFFQREDPVGTSVTGTVESIEAQQQRDMDTQAPKFFDNGDPMMQIVVHVSTTLRDPAIPGDDGVRAVYVKGKNIAALRTASHRVGRDFPHVGDGFKATYTANGVAKKRGWNAPKLYSYEIVPNQAQVAQAMDGAAPQRPAPAPQQSSFPQQAQPAQPAGQQPLPGYGQPQAAPLDENSIRQLAATGMDADRIAALTGADVQAVRDVLDASAF